jgi:hypothetical protein
MQQVFIYLIYSIEFMNQFRMKFSSKVVFVKVLLILMMDKD